VPRRSIVIKCVEHQCGYEVGSACGQPSMSACEIDRRLGSTVSGAAIIPKFVDLKRNLKNTAKDFSDRFDEILALCGTALGVQH